MPTYQLKSAKTGKDYSVNFDSPPSDSDVDEAIAHFDGASKPDPMAEYKAFKKQYEEDAAQGPGGKLLDETGKALSGLGQMIKTGIEAPFSVLGGEAHVLSQSKSPMEAIRNIQQSQAEGMGRIGYGILSGVRSMANAAGRQIVDHPIESLAPLSPLSLYSRAQRLKSRTPAESEIQSAFDRQQADQAFERQGNVLPEIVGKTNERIARGVSDLPNTLMTVQGAMAAPALLAKPLRFVAKAAEPIRNIGIVRTVEKVGGASGRVLGKTAMAPVNALKTVSIQDDWLSALDPKARAIDPKKTVLAMKVAKGNADIATLDVPDLFEKGYSLETAQKAADTALAAKQAIWKERQALVKSGEKLEVSLDPVADAIEAVTEKPENVRFFGADSFDALKKQAKNYRGATASPEEAEAINRIFNATVEKKKAMLPAVDAAKLEKADPEFSAMLGASRALKGELENSLGKQFPELGKRYGAWANIADHAERQAAYQFKLNNRASLGETMAAIDAAGNPITGGLKVLAAKTMKEIYSPDAKFQRLDARLRREIASGKLKPRPPAEPLPPSPPAIPKPPPAPPDPATVQSAAFRQSLEDLAAPRPANIGALSRVAPMKPRGPLASASLTREIPKGPTALEQAALEQQAIQERNLGAVQPVKPVITPEDAVTAQSEAYRKSLEAASARKPALEEWADKTIAEGRKRANAGLDPEQFAAHAIKGGYLIARGVKDFAAWSKEMISQFGETIKPHLEELWKSSLEHAKLFVEKEGVPVDAISNAGKKSVLYGGALPDETLAVRSGGEPKVLSREVEKAKAPQTGVAFADSPNRGGLGQIIYRTPFLRVIKTVPPSFDLGSIQPSNVVVYETAAKFRGAWRTIQRSNDLRDAIIPFEGSSTAIGASLRGLTEDKMLDLAIKNGMTREEFVDHIISGEKSKIVGAAVKTPEGIKQGNDAQIAKANGQLPEGETELRSHMLREEGAPKLSGAKEQAVWLDTQAKAAGYRGGINEMALDPEGGKTATEMMKQWRSFHLESTPEKGYILGDEKLGIKAPKSGAKTARAGGGGSGAANPLDDAENVTEGIRRASQLVPEEQGNGRVSISKRTRRLDSKAETDLVDWSKKNGRLISKLPKKWEFKGTLDRGESEHHVFLDQDIGRVFKMPVNGIPKNPEFTSEWMVKGKNTDGWFLKSGGIAEYLKRLKNQNEVFGDDIRLHGIYKDKNGAVYPIISQPAVKGVPLTDADLPRIEKAMADRGFVALGDSAYYRAKDNTLVVDAHVGNMLDVNGTLVPFDTMVVHPEGDFKDFLEGEIFSKKVASIKSE